MMWLINRLCVVNTYQLTIYNCSLLYMLLHCTVVLMLLHYITDRHDLTFKVAYLKLSWLKKIYINKDTEGYKED